MLPTIDLLINIADPQRQGLLASFKTQGQTAINSLVFSDGEQLRIRCVKPSATAGKLWDCVDISTAAVEVAIGAFNQTSTAGIFYLRTGSTATSGVLVSGSRYLITSFQAGDNFSNVGASSNGTGVVFVATGTAPTTWTNGSQLEEITVDLPNNATAAQAATALNATAAVTGAGGVSLVAQAPGVFIVTFTAAGARPLLAGNGTLLDPLSSVVVTRLTPGSSEAQEIQLVRIVVNPFCYAQPNTPLPAATAAVAQVQVGDSSHPSIQSVTLGVPGYAGGWKVTIGANTYVIPYNAVASDIQTLVGNGVLTVSSSGTSGNVFLFTWSANGAQPAISTDPSGLSVPIGVSGPLATNTEGVLAAFAKAGMPNSISLWFQVKLTFPWENPRTVLLVPVAINSTVIDTGSMIPTPLPGYYTQVQSDARFFPIDASALPAADPHVLNRYYRSGDFIAISNG